MIETGDLGVPDTERSVIATFESKSEKTGTIRKMGGRQTNLEQDIKRHVGEVLQTAPLASQYLTRISCGYMII